VKKYVESTSSLVRAMRFHFYLSDNFFQLFRSNQPAYVVMDEFYRKVNTYIEL
jgi:hypothetical protein